METLEERIRSRFEWGLMADIGAPDYETRMAILRRKVESDDMSLSDDILNYIANNIKSNIRELEGALNKLLAYSNLEKTEITMEIAKKELQNIITPDKPREITPQLIIEVVSEHFQISLDQMISKNRRRIPFHMSSIRRRRIRSTPTRSGCSPRRISGSGSCPTWWYPVCFPSRRVKRSCRSCGRRCRWCRAG